ncbi:MAG: hypothetical protein AAFU83_01275, partial [Bacteroidota bacterium]
QSMAAGAVIENAMRGQKSTEIPSYNYTKMVTKKSGEVKINNHITGDAVVPTPQDLAKDALQISESIEGSTDHTTILCVALRNSKQRIKKFVFHNGGEKELRSGNLVKKAHTLGYHFIQSQQSHAEGQFIQFLYQRWRQHPGYYTHIVGMGCSRKHCPECGFLLQLILGNEYREITAVIGDLEPPEEVSIESIPPSRLRLIKKRQFSVITSSADREGGSNTLCRDRKARKFYMPHLLLEVIEKHTGYSIEIAGQRYVE